MYYDANNLRRDVVTYKPVNVDKIGSLTARYIVSALPFTVIRLKIIYLRKVDPCSGPALIKEYVKIHWLNNPHYWVIRLYEKCMKLVKLHIFFESACSIDPLS